ncbi:cellulase family glycosylhydrolase [Saccharicrinis aurantiacus]|uniref:cellulase family glycosylhydrolase n=1 Tax=Saccharicrinis aurantiacus TaxID=1849719 RepID=UPI0024931B95|nr:cellulase family glycosylhydrolase [Saccharicrinis aurantiacus]
MRYFISMLLVVMLFTACGHENADVIKIKTSEVISTNFIGNGVQWSAYPHADTENAVWGKLMTDEKWDMNFTRLNYMKPKLFRVCDQANWRYMVGFDKQGNPILDFDTPEVKAVEKIFDYAQENNITVLIGEWGTPYKMHDKDAGHSDKFFGANDPKWINSIVAYLDYLINTKGYTCIKYYNLVNEPNGDWASVKGDFVEWSEGVKMLASALKEKGLDKQISVAGPDAVTRYDNPRSTYTGAGWVEESAKQLGNEIGIFEVHDYTDHELVRSGGFKKYHGDIAKYAKDAGKQIIFGELGFSRNSEENQARAKADPFACEDSQMEVYDYSYGVDMADALIQSMNAGYSGAAAWALDDAMHTLDDLGHKHQIKRWGMWNSLGTELANNPEDENIRPWFYSWSLMCRYFPTGSTIVNTDASGKDGVRITAGVLNEDITVALVNNSSVQDTLALDLSMATHLQKFVYQEGNSKVDDNGFPMAVASNIKASNNFEVILPAKSFVLFTSLKY